MEINVRSSISRNLIRKISGRIVAELSKNDFALIRTFYEEGRKVGIEITFDSNVELKDLPNQIKSLSLGDFGVPLYQTDVVIQVKG